MKLLLLLVIILLSSSFLIEKSLGESPSIVDVNSSAIIKKPQLSCLKERGYEKIIIQSWSGNNGYNYALKDTYNQAIESGMKVDVYASFCSNCIGNSPSSIAIKTLIYNLMVENIKFDKIWIDIEKEGDNWDDQKSNAEYIMEAIDVARQLGVEIGIYTSRKDWESVIGSFSSLHNYPLWIKLTNDIKNDFGGWEAPSLIQNIKNAKICGLSVNLNTNHTINPNSTNPPNNTVSNDVYHTPNHTISPNSTNPPNNTVPIDVYLVSNHTISPNSTNPPNNTVPIDLYHTPNHTISPNSTNPPNNTVPIDVYHTPNHTINPNSTNPPNNTVPIDVYYTPNHTLSPNSTNSPNNTVPIDVYLVSNHTISPNSTNPPNNTVSVDVYHAPNHTISPNTTNAPNNTIQYDTYQNSNHTINPNSTTSGNSTTTSSSVNQTVPIGTFASTGKGDSVNNNNNNNKNNGDYVYTKITKQNGLRKTNNY